MKYLSVCSGIEAATQAWHPMGWQPFAFSEIENFPSAVLEHHYPHVPNLGDMTKFKEWPNANIDVLVGGTPCQSFSVAGLRKGLDDPRGNLMLTYLAIARRYQPQWLVWENVPGVLSSSGGRDFGTFLGGLAELGYGFAYRVLDAQYVRTQRFRGAVPQRRRRVFVVGHLGDWRRAAAVLFDAESLSGNPPPRREAGKRTAAATGAGAESGGLRLATARMVAFGEYADDGTASAMKHRDYKDATDLVVAPTIGSGAPYSKTGNARVESDALVPIALGWQNSPSQGDSASSEITPTLDKSKTPAVAIRTANTSSNGHGFSEEIAYTLDQAQGQAVAHCFPINTKMALRGAETSNSSREGVGIGSAGDPAFTLQAAHHHAVAFAENSRAEIRLCGGDGSVMSQLTTGGGKLGQGQPVIARPWAVRRLAPEECEALQGFPRGFTQIPYRGKPADKCPDGPRYKALGNSMAVNCMEWIGQRISMVDSW